MEVSHRRSVRCTFFFSLREGLLTRGGENRPLPTSATSLRWTHQRCSTERLRRCDSARSCEIWPRKSDRIVSHLSTKLYHEFVELSFYSDCALSLTISFRRVSIACRRSRSVHSTRLRESVLLSLVHSISGRPEADRLFLVSCHFSKISTNDAGIEVCENRLSYLVAKGAVLRKGQRLRSRFCKYSRSAADCHFTAILYVSDEDQVYRYTDEGEIVELCRWTYVRLRVSSQFENDSHSLLFRRVDLSPLPSFQYHAQTSSAGFYTE